VQIKPSNNSLALTWFGLVAPAGTADEIVKRIHSGVIAALRAPGMREKLGNLGLYPSTLTSSQQFGLQIRSELEQMQRIARIAKIQIDQ
jgi:tripartite-type tricarboxylate transporter receptor subunit TctC